MHVPSRGTADLPTCMDVLAGLIGEVSLLLVLRRPEQLAMYAGDITRELLLVACLTFTAKRQK